MQGAGEIAYHPWPHRLAVLLACATFPLIWVGGLVTTYDAGMAVPDWPGTYGYNLFLYPWQTWLFGPWDLFIEHGHRLLGALSGLLTIAVVVAVYRADDRRWVRWFSLGALAAVTGQGCLGGARVLLDERQLAMLHGCLGPAFFAVCMALCAVTARWWRDAGAGRSLESSPRLHQLILAFPVLAYIQLVLGALMRHVPESASPTYFVIIVWAHLIGAGALIAILSLVGLRTLRGAAAHSAFWWPSVILIALVVIQLILGCATWVVNYLWPTFVVRTAITTTYTLIEAKGLLQSLVVTAHAANGTLILGISVLLAMRGLRLVRVRRAEFAPDTVAMGSVTG